METINQSMTPCTCQAPYAQRSFNASQTQLAAVSSSQSLDLDIVTEEGDKVTLSMDAKASALYASHGQVQGDEDGFFAQWGELSAGQYEREVTFSVEGDLNAEERREIRKVIKTINRMMHNFVHGKIKPMMAKAGKLTGLETIDSLEVNMAYERQVVVARQSQVAVGYDQYGAAREEPAAMTPALKTDTSQVPLEAESNAVAQEMAREATSAQAPLANVLEAIDRLLKAYQDMVRQWNPLGGDIMDQVQDSFDAPLSATGHSDPFSVSVMVDVEV